MNNEHLEIEIGDLEFVSAHLDNMLFIEKYNERQRFEPLCRQCPNWNKRWGCPPFDFDTDSILKSYSKVKVYCVEANITRWSDSAGIDEMNKTIQSIRKIFEPKLLIEEKQEGGVAALFTGMCYHCGDSECARLKNLPCRHPELVRPSLEALGFDIGKIMTEVFGRELEWFKPGQPIPRHLRLVGAVFY